MQLGTRLTRGRAATPSPKVQKGASCQSATADVVACTRTRPRAGSHDRNGSRRASVHASMLAQGVQARDGSGAASVQDTMRDHGLQAHDGHSAALVRASMFAHGFHDHDGTFAASATMRNQPDDQSASVQAQVLPQGAHVHDGSNTASVHAPMLVQGAYEHACAAVRNMIPSQSRDPFSMMLREAREIQQQQLEASQGGPHATVGSGAASDHALVPTHGSHAHDGSDVRDVSGAASMR